MQFYSWLLDKKTNGINFSIDMTVEEYLTLSENIIDKNNLQRSKVKSSGKVYELLRRDLLTGCVMPPIILAVTERLGKTTHIVEITQKSIYNNDIDHDDISTLHDFIRKALLSSEVIILDGLQRTFTLQQTAEDARERNIYESFSQTRIRAEIYLGLNKTGILYRMLTLNTGQTPMTFRHQIEILYHDYISNYSLPDNIRVHREVDSSRARGVSDYRYQDVVDMFYAFSTGSPKSFDRQALVAELKEMDFLEEYKPDKEDTLFSLLKAYNYFLTHIDSLGGGWRSSQSDVESSQSENDFKDENSRVSRPFGTTVPSIFGRVQPMTGFGAECKRLLRSGKLVSIEELNSVITGCSFKETPSNEALDNLIIILDQIASKAKKIGDAQRAYFQLVYRELFNDEADGFQNLSTCWLYAQEKYELLYGSN